MANMGQELLDRFISCKKSEIIKFRPIIAAFVGRNSRDTMIRLIGETKKVTKWQWTHATIHSKWSGPYKEPIKNSHSKSKVKMSTIHWLLRKLDNPNSIQR